MKKASAIVLYDAQSNQIYNLTINHNGNLIPLINYSESKATPYKYKTFNEMLRVLASVTSNIEYFGSREFVEHFTESIEKNNSYAYIWNDKFNIEHCVSVFVKTFDACDNI